MKIKITEAYEFTGTRVELDRATVYNAVPAPELPDYEIHQWVRIPDINKGCGICLKKGEYEEAPIEFRIDSSVWKFYESSGKLEHPDGFLTSWMREDMSGCWVPGEWACDMNDHTKHLIVNSVNKKEELNLP